ncbi:MAG: murein biosynthesis integral membrane protein MurJ [Romboutsia sp.]
MNKLVKATTILFLITILSKFFGFFRETILVSIYGASMISDAYITSMKIPSTLFAIIASALSTTFIPIFCDIDKNEGKEKSLKFANNVFNIVILLSLFLAIIGFIFAEPLVKVFAIDFDGEKLKLTVQFTKIMVFSMIFIGLNSMMTCWLQIKEKYHIPGLMGFPYNIIIIASILISVKVDIEILAIGTLLAIISQFLFQLPYASKCGYKYELYVNFKDENIKKIIYLLLPVIIGVGVGEINGIIDGTLASTLGDGIITVLNSANKLNDFVTGLFIATIISVIYPILSKLSQSNEKEFKKIIIQSINILLLLLIPISIGAIVLSVPVVRVVFERGKFDYNSTILTAQALKYYAIGITAGGITTVLNRVFYSMQDTKTPMINSVISIIINIVLNLILINYMGHRGLALATSISAIIRVILLFRKLKLRIVDFNQNLIIKTMTKSLIASIIMGGITYISYIILKASIGISFIGELIILFIPILIGAIIYSIIITNMKIDEVNIILDIIKLKLKIR